MIILAVFKPEKTAGEQIDCYQRDQKIQQNPVDHHGCFGSARVVIENRPHGSRDAECGCVVIQTVQYEVHGIRNNGPVTDRVCGDHIDHGECDHGIHIYAHKFMPPRIRVENGFHPDRENDKNKYGCYVKRYIVMHGYSISQRG